jgi:hypothetical protein
MSQFRRRGLIELKRRQMRIPDLGALERVRDAPSGPTQLPPLPVQRRRNRSQRADALTQPSSGSSSATIPRKTEIDPSGDSSLSSSERNGPIAG